MSVSGRLHHGDKGVKCQRTAAKRGRHLIRRSCTLRLTEGTRSLHERSSWLLVLWRCCEALPEVQDFRLWRGCGGCGNCALTAILRDCLTEHQIQRTELRPHQQSNLKQNSIRHHQVVSVIAAITENCIVYNGSCTADVYSDNPTLRPLTNERAGFAMSSFGLTIYSYRSGIRSHENTTFPCILGMRNCCFYYYCALLDLIRSRTC